MKTPNKPINENERSEALAEFDIIDSLPEEEYDNITKLASYICNTPISLVTFIDKERQFFKSAIGMSSAGTTRDEAFCAHAINYPSEIMIVQDARLDNRFHDNPLVTEDPHIVFYAGMPLVTNDGYSFGTLCVIDNEPRELSAVQLEALKMLSKQVVKLLELRKSSQLLKASQKKLEAYAEEMKAFAHLASHDLKEPARMVYSFMKLLENNYASQLDERAKKYIHFAADGASRMTVLIDDLLVFSTTEALNKVKEEINVENLLTEVVSLLTGVINKKNAIVEWGNLPVITAPVMAIKMIFQNLIGNAIKYQASGIQPKVTITAMETDSHWQFEVKDNGIGIDEIHREEIFQLFKRLHTTAIYPGTGLGLATCKKIVESLGGLIWVKSAADGGSVFIFTVKKS